MHALAILFFVIGMMAVLSPTENYTVRDATDDIVATNYAAYRTSVLRYVYDERLTSNQTILTSELTLPIGYVFLRNWQARVYNDCVYIYGDVSQREVAAIMAHYEQSYELGYKNGTNLVGPGGNSQISLPNFINNGAIVSVTKVP